MRSLDEIRKDIDAIDQQIRDLLMKRLDCSEQVVASKIEAKNYVIFRADREKMMLENLAQGVPEKRKAGYLSVVRKVTETSRMYQYGILYEQAPELYENLVRGLTIPEHTDSITVQLTRRDIPNSMSAILSMIGDYGYNMDQMRIVGYSEDKSNVIFELKILGDLAYDNMKKMVLQLSMESKDFSVVGCTEE